MIRRRVVIRCRIAIQSLEMLLVTAIQRNDSSPKMPESRDGSTNICISLMYWTNFDSHRRSADDTGCYESYCVYSCVTLSFKWRIGTPCLTETLLAATRECSTRKSYTALKTATSSGGRPKFGANFVTVSCLRRHSLDVLCDRHEQWHPSNCSALRYKCGERNCR